MDLRYGVGRGEEMHQHVELRGNAIIIAFTVVDDVVVSAAAIASASSWD